MYSPSIFLALLLATAPVPTEIDICADIKVQLDRAVAEAGLDPAVAEQVISNCLANN